MRKTVALLLIVAASTGWSQDRQKLLIDRQRGPDGQITILDAVYGQDDRICRAQQAVARDCDGRPSCDIRATDALCGNPYANVTKQLFIGYSCGSDRRSVTVNEGEVAYVYCLAQADGSDSDQPGDDDEGRVAVPPDQPPANWRRGRLYIASAIYGAGSETCDARTALSYECDGQRSCEIEMGNNLCGDPARGVRKQALVEYWCDGALARRTFEEGERALLNCR